MPTLLTKGSQTTTIRHVDLKILGNSIIKKLGRPWVALGRGPDGYDCWGLVVSVWEDIGWTSAPDFPYGSEFTERREALVSIVEEKKVHDINWIPRESPADGCLCVMFKYGHAYHVGIYADGTVFHCVEGRGVLGTSVQKTLTLGYEKIEFYDNKEMPWL